MIRFRTTFLTLFGLALFFSACNKDEIPGEVVYTVTFTGTWSAQDHPTDYPSNAHFSRAIGWTHQPGAQFFEVGQLASEGMEVMAETGDVTPLDNEIQALVDAGQGLALIVGERLSTGTESATFEIGLSKDFPEVTLVTMIAPSPDWFVAVEAIKLLDGDEWMDNLVVDAITYDAGTDSGESFTSENMDTDPAENIQLLTAPPLGDGVAIDPPLVQFTFERKN